MQQNSIPFTKDLVLIGGGHCHALFLLKWAKNPLPGVRVTLISPEVNAPYTGMLPGYVAGHYFLDDLNMDLVRVAQHANTRLLLDSVKDIDLQTQRVQRSAGPDIYFDLLSMNVGITLSLNELEGFSEFGIPAKPLGLFAKKWDDYFDRVSKGNFTPNVVIIGAGVAGVELSLSMKHRLDKISSLECNVTLIEQKQEILQELSPSTRQKISKHLNKHKITRICSTNVNRITSQGVALTSGDFVPASFVVGAAGAQSIPWIEKTQIPSKNGFIMIDQYLRSTTPYGKVFAVGDCAYNSETNLPRAGVYAVRQAPILYHNLKATLTGKKLKPFKPQSDFLKLISTGNKNAIGSKFSFSAEGSTIWKWKNFIDKKFMERFDLDLTPTQPPIPNEIPLESKPVIDTANHLCAGCGAKVGLSNLHHVLNETDVAINPNWLGDAAEIQLGSHQVAISTDHLRSFTLDHALFTKISALHAMSDIWSKGAQPKYALAIITIPFMAETLQRETLREIMEVAKRTFQDAGAEIIGGHTSQGSELTIGFTVMSETNPSSFLTHSGANAGDNIIITKPIGTGVMLAGNMRGKVLGEKLFNTYDVMLQSSQKASQILAKSATAMTDVTGFGLAGHLLDILQHSNKKALLQLNTIPLIEGSLELSLSGIQSTLWQSNALVGKYFSDLSNPKCDLLFDPQTSGGLCATIPHQHTQETLYQLHSSGVQATVIGTLTEGLPFVEVIHD